MADAFIGLPVDGAGKKLDTEELTVGVNLVHRERNQLAGVDDDDIAVVTDTDAAGTDHGLAVRQVPPVSLHVDFVTSSSLAPLASIDLDGATIAAATTGKLLRALVSSSVPCKWEIKTRDGGAEILVAVLFTSGVTVKANDRYVPSSKEGVTLAGAGVDENFRVTVTNLGALSADVYTTIEWDEV